MKYILVTVFTLTIFQFGSAQIQLGVKAGVNFSTLRFTGSSVSDKYQSVTDFNGGLIISVPLDQNFSIQPEVVYSEQGSVAPQAAGNKFQIKYQYINIPVLFKYIHSSGLFAETGPQIGFLLSANVNNGVSYSIKSTTEPVDCSWSFGLGYKIPDLNLGIDARYNRGLTNTAKTGSVVSKNSVFQIDLLYQLKAL